MSIQIPLRPKNDAEFSQIKLLDKKIIVAAVLLQLDNQAAFALYHPEYVDGKGRLNDAGKKDSRFFWNYGKHKDYRAAYEETLEEFLNGKKRSARGESVSIDDSRKDRALKSLLNQAMSMVEGGAELDADTLKTVTEIFKKLNILKDEEEVQEKPRRYLPELCSACLYRSFIESHVENGDIISECDYCRTRKFAEDNGWRFDPTKNLDLPNTNSDEQDNTEN